MKILIPNCAQKIITWRQFFSFKLSITAFIQRVIDISLMRCSLAHLPSSQMSLRASRRVCICGMLAMPHNMLGKINCPQVNLFSPRNKILSLFSMHICLQLKRQLHFMKFEKICQPQKYPQPLVDSRVFPVELLNEQRHFYFVLFFETRFLWITTQTDLELTLQTRLALNSQRSVCLYLPLGPQCWD